MTYHDKKGCWILAFLNISVLTPLKMCSGTTATLYCTWDWRSWHWLGQFCLSMLPSEEGAALELVLAALELLGSALELLAPVLSSSGPTSSSFVLLDSRSAWGKKLWCVYRHSLQMIKKIHTDVIFNFIDRCFRCLLTVQVQNKVKNTF